MRSSASSGRIVLALAALLVLGAVGVVFYSVARWQKTFSGSIVAVKSPEPTLQLLPPASPEAESSAPFLLDQPSANAATGNPQNIAPTTPVDAKTLRAELQKTGMDPALLKQVSDLQLVEMYRQFTAQQAGKNTNP